MFSVGPKGFPLSATDSSTEKIEKVILLWLPFGMCVSCVYDSKDVFALLALKVTLPPKAKHETYLFIQDASEWEDEKMNFALNIPDVQGHKDEVSRYFALACTDKSLSKYKPGNILSWTATVPEITPKWI